MIRKIVLLESRFEAQHFLNSLSEQPSNSSEYGIVCFNISTRKYLEQHNLYCFDLFNFFSTKDHILALHQLDKIDQCIKDWFNENCDSKYLVFYHSFSYYTLLYYSHFIYCLTCLENILKENEKINELITPEYKYNSISSPFLEENESQLAAVAKTIKTSYNLKLKFITLEPQKKMPLRRTALNQLFVKAGNALNLFILDKFFTKDTLWISATSNRCDLVALQVKNEVGIKRIISLHGINRMQPTLYSGLIYFAKSLISSFRSLTTRGPEHFIKHRFDYYFYTHTTHIQKWVNKLLPLKQVISKIPEMNNHITTLLDNKIDNGIIPILATLDKLDSDLSKILINKKPIGIISPHSLNGSQLLGDLCKKFNIPGVLISHGSHNIPPIQSLNGEFYRHGLGLILSNYPYCAIQSPFALKFINYYSSNSKPIITGPLLWGKKFNEANFSKKRKIKILTHAGSQKPRWGQRFMFYETADEYIHSICSLSEAVSQMSDVLLIIRFRPTPNLTLDDLKERIAKYNNVEISCEGPFLPILAQTDLLISYSSTTIEEAIENRIPVLQYSRDNRFNFMPSKTITDLQKLNFYPVYSIDNKIEVGKAIENILEAVEGAKDVESSYQTYSFPKCERLNISDLIKKWLTNQN